MIKLNFNILDGPITIDKMTIFTIEDSVVFSQLIQLIYNYNDNDESDLKIFDHLNNSIKDSEISTITDILGFNINSNKLLKLIYANLEEQLNEKPEVKTMIDKLTSTVQDLINYELIDHELDLVGDEITIRELFKVLGIRIEVESDTIFEKLLEIIKVHKYLSKIELLIFINVGSYLTRDQILEVSHYISLLNIDVLFLETNRIKDFPYILLDNDYFLSVENGIIE